MAGIVPADHANLAVPAMPAVSSEEIWFDSPFTLGEGGRYTIGWQRWTERKGGPAFVTLRRNAFGTLKIVQRYPLTAEGWTQAWRALVVLDPGAAEEARKALDQRAKRQRDAQELVRLDTASLGNVPGVVFLGGYAVESDLAVGSLYDLRFFDDQLAIYAAGQSAPALGFRYGQLHEVEIGGPVSTWSRARQAVMSAAFGPIGAFMVAVDAKFETVVRVQAADHELFFLHTTSHPDVLRIELSPALGRIRHAQAASKQVSIADELARLAAMVDRGILTREEFNRLKARLIAG